MTFTITIPDWALWILAAMFVVSAGLTAWKIHITRRFRDRGDM